MSGVSETKYLVQHESCHCKYKCNSRKKKWNHDKCRCDCKELHDWGSCKNDYMWNLDHMYLDIKNRSCE